MNTERKKDSLYLGLIAVMALGCVVSSLFPIYTKKDLVDPGLFLGKWNVELSDDPVFAKSDHEGENPVEVVGDIWIFSWKDDDFLLETRMEKSGGLVITNQFQANLARVKGRLFLNLTPSELEKRESPLYTLARFPHHVFFLIEPNSEKIVVHPVNNAWLLKHLRQHPKSLDHKLVKGGGDSFRKNDKKGHPPSIGRPQEKGSVPSLNEDDGNKNKAKDDQDDPYIVLTARSTELQEFFLRHEKESFKGSFILRRAQEEK